MPLYQSRLAHGRALLDTLLSESEPLEAQLTACKDLVAEASITIQASPDWRQLRQLMDKAAANYGPATGDASAAAGPSASAGAGTSSGQRLGQSSTVGTIVASVNPSDRDHHAASQRTTTTSQSSSPGSSAWGWHCIQTAAVYGLGSLYEYRALIADGGRTDNNCKRAGMRLYQLALATLLPQLLPGLQGELADIGQCDSKC